MESERCFGTQEAPQQFTRMQMKFCNISILKVR